MAIMTTLQYYDTKDNEKRLKKLSPLVEELTGVILEQKNITPKEKAEQLIYAFEAFTDSANEYKFAIQCASIAVDEIIKFGNQSGIREPMMYWNKVKEELKKL